MYVKGINLIFLSGLAALGMPPVNGMKIYTSSEVEAVNGTNFRLKCTFQSTAPIRPASLTVSWHFRPLGPGQEESIFYYHERPYPPIDGRFHSKVVWSGDIMGRDASITLQAVNFAYNGTFSCQVKNPPDVHGVAGEVRLRVVTKASFSEIAILAAAIGGAIVLVLIILTIIFCVRRGHLQNQEDNTELPRGDKKDPSVL